jgi:DNA-3-methyladenine glycosylase
MRLKRSFFEKPTLQVAQALLGKTIFFKDKSIIINETEAYLAKGDPACHAAKGMTPRTKVMFGPAGFTYVYLIYGMYHCLNFVTEGEGCAAAVLIRGGTDSETAVSYNGPGKLCKHLGVTKDDHNNLDTIVSEDFYVLDYGRKPKFFTTPRIGIKEGTEHLWRFVAA